jgi:cbb3-type cytochrome oxidase subunit 3
MTLAEIGDQVGVGWLALMVVLFVGVVFWAIRGRNQARRDNDSAFPYPPDENGV